MSNICKNTIRVIGSSESVAEVAMFILQDHKVRLDTVLPGNESVAACVEIGHQHELLSSRFSDKPINVREASTSINDALHFASYGIRAITQSESSTLFELSAECETRWNPPWALSKQLSKRFPDAVVGVESVYATEAEWWHLTLSGGVVKSNLKVANMPGSAGREQSLILNVDGSGELSAFARRERESIATDLLISSSDRIATQIPLELRDHGWPRWSLMAHAAFTSGVSGLKESIGVLATADEIEEALKSDMDAAKRLGVASWVDSSLFGESTPSEDKPPASFLDLSGRTQRSRQLELLEVIAEANKVGAEFSPFSQALVASLADPLTRLIGGLHPAVYLTATVSNGSAGPAAHAGLDLLLQGLAAKMPSIRGAETLGTAPLHDVGTTHEATPLDGVLRSALAVAALPRVSKHQLSPALAAGVTPKVLLWTLLARGLADDSMVDTRSLNVGAIDSLVDAYGSASKFPEQLKTEIESIGSNLQEAFEARKTHELMQSQIAKDVVGRASEAAPQRHRRAKI